MGYDDPGKIAYYAYKKSRHGLTLNGIRMQEWEKLSEELQEAWDNVAAALGEYYTDARDGHTMNWKRYVGIQ